MRRNLDRLTSKRARTATGGTSFFVRILANCSRRPRPEGSGIKKGSRLWRKRTKRNKARRKSTKEEEKGSVAKEEWPGMGIKGREPRGCTGVEEGAGERNVRKKW